MEVFYFLNPLKRKIKMNEIVKFCNLNDQDNELIKRFEKLNLKRQDVYLIKAEGKCYICFK